MGKMASAVQTAIGSVARAWKAVALPPDSSDELRAAPPPLTTREALLNAFQEQRIAIVSTTTKRASRVTIPADVLASVVAALTNQPQGGSLATENGDRIILESGSGTIKAE